MTGLPAVFAAQPAGFRVSTPEALGDYIAALIRRAGLHHPPSGGVQTLAYPSDGAIGGGFQTRRYPSDSSSY